jgi:AraC-like DNA-binding protein
MEKQDSGIRFETFDIGVQRLYIWQQKYGSTSAHYHECIELIHMLKGNITLTADVCDCQAQYITSLRTTMACRLLSEQPELSLAEIAEHVGFQSMRSMLRAFRRHYNCAPSEMKKPQSTKL